MKSKSDSKSSPKKYSAKRLVLLGLGALAGLALVSVLLVVFALAMAYPNLPALDTITDYRPKMPLRIFTADNVLIGEFGEERRTLVRFKDIPDVMKKAVLSIEDDRFYQHGGVDYMGVLRATLHNATSSTPVRARPVRPARVSRIRRFGLNLFAAGDFDDWEDFMLDFTVLIRLLIRHCSPLRRGRGGKHASWHA